MPLFTKEADYEAFERVLEEAFAREPLRILGYCLMPNHWHLVVWPKLGAGRQPFGSDAWTTRTIAKLELQHTVRPRGRPRKAPPVP